VDLMCRQDLNADCIENENAWKAALIWPQIRVRPGSLPGPVGQL